MQAVQQGQRLIHDICTNLAVGLAMVTALRLADGHTEQVNSFSSTTLPLLLVPSAMSADATFNLSSCDHLLPSGECSGERRGSWRDSGRLWLKPCSEASTVSCHSGIRADPCRCRN